LQASAINCFKHGGELNQNIGIIGKKWKEKCYKKDEIGGDTRRAHDGR
jgi:hypothetical protein